MKGETGATLLSRPWAALPGLTQQPHARQTGQAGRRAATTGAIPAAAGQTGEFLSLETISETPMKKTRFSCRLMGLKGGFCPPQSGRPWGHRKGQPS